MAEPCLHAHHARNGSFRMGSGHASLGLARVTESNLPTTPLETFTGLNLHPRTQQPVSPEREGGWLSPP